LRALPQVNPEGTRRLEIVCPEATRALQILRHVPGVEQATIFGQAIHALVSAAMAEGDLTRALSSKGILVETIRAVTATLEDVFVQLTLLRRQELEAAHA
jgi:hypothetical protein